MNHSKRLAKCSTWAVLISMAAQNVALAATPGQRESIRADIASEFEKRYEQDTPGVGPSIGDKLLASSSKAIKEDVIDMLTDFKMGVVNGANLAMNGNGTIVVIGAKNGWKLFKDYGESAGIRYVDSVYLLPKKAVTIGKGFAKAAVNVATLAANDAESTGRAWNKAGGEIAQDAKDLASMTGSIARWTGGQYADAARDMKAGVENGADNAATWTRDVLSWTGHQTANAFVDLTNGTVENAKATGRWTEAVGKFWVDATVDAATSVNDWTKATWDWTVNATDSSWKITKAVGSGTATWTVDNTVAGGKWLTSNVTTPARQAIDATEAYSKWNWKRGYSQGIKEGFRTAGQAWDHDDKLMATLWTMAGVGQAGLHILLLEPTVVPMLAGYGVAGTVALSTLGYPSVGAFFLGGMALSGAAYAAGTALTGATATVGTAATLVAGGGGILRTSVTGAIGISATAATAVGGAAYTTGLAGINAARVIGTPIIGGIGALGAAGAGGVEIAGSVALNSARMVGVTALSTVGEASITAFEAARMTFSALQAAGATVYDNAIVTPVGVVVNLAQALGTGAWTLAEDPVYGTLDVLAASGIAVGTIATSTGAFSYELVKGIVKGLVSGIEVVGQSGIWIVGAVAKGIEFIGAALNLPQHKAWAQFRRTEVEEVLDRIRQEADSDLASRFGDIILVRVHWWGEDQGHVRFFVTKNPTTGERWYFGRIIDKDTCKVMYKITNQDPIVRAFTQKAWTGVYQSGFDAKNCTSK